MRIVITGAGIVSALGIGKEANTKALLNEQSGIATPVILPTKHKLPVGEVKLTNAELKTLLGVSDEEVISRTALLSIAAAREALDEAGICRTDEMTFLSGTTVGGMDYTEQHWCERDAYADAIIKTHSAGDATEQAARHIGKFAFRSTLSTACSSALNAVITACNMLRTGRATQVLAGGAESLSLFHFNGFRSLQILSPEPCRPFSDDRQGLNLGEGAAYVVIESEESARLRGSNILAYIAGYGNACDAHHQTASSEGGEGAYCAMQQAILMSGLPTTEVDYINAHGTATPNNDASEAAAMIRLFGKHNMPAVSSTKGFTGHATSAAGSIELVISLLAMQQGFVPANLGWRTAMDNGLRPTLHNTPCALHTVLCNSFGFGGNDSSVLLTDDASGHALTTCTQEPDIAELAATEVSNDADWKQHIPVIAGRRLTPKMRCLLMAAKQALAESGGNMPEAIITGTDWGCIYNSVQLLDQLTQEGEDALSPTLFMQSTHNTPSSLIAIQTGNHGYNATYSHGRDSFSHALLDARMQLQLGLINSALVLGFEERDEVWSQLTDNAKQTYQPFAKAVILQRHA